MNKTTPDKCCKKCNHTINYNNTLCFCGKSWEECHTPTPDKEKWEDVFARDFFNDDNWPINEYYRTLTFIRQTLASQKADLIKEAEKLSFTLTNNYGWGEYRNLKNNRKLVWWDEILSILRKER